MALPQVSMAQPSPRAVSKKPRCPKSRLCIQEASSGHRLRPALACLRRPGASSRNGHEAGVGEVAVTHSRAVSSCSATTRTNVVGNPAQCLPLPMEMGTGVGSTTYKPSHREKWGAGDCQGPDLEGGWKPQASGQGATCV